MIFLGKNTFNTGIFAILNGAEIKTIKMNTGLYFKIIKFHHHSKLYEWMKTKPKDVFLSWAWSHTFEPLAGKAAVDNLKLTKTHTLGQCLFC